MNISKIDNTEKFIYLSGMFAGGWMWREPTYGLSNSMHHLIQDPLCNIGATVDEITEKIAKELVKEGGPVNLISNSLGSLVSLKLAMLLPRNIKSVVISGSSGFSAVDLGIKLRPKDPEGMAKELLEIICYDKSKATEKYCTNMADTLRSSFPNIVSLIRESNNIRAEEYLAGVNCPVHAIWGENDVITPLSSTQDALGRHNVTTTIIDHCGHSPMFEKPKQFGELVSSCLT